MRNLKRALSLTLASVMLLGMMVVGSSAAGYPDVSDEDNVEAIEVLQKVAVMEGDNNGNFNPDDYVTREQMAVIMSKLLKLDYNYYQGTNPFSDVPAWAAPYVAACAANGITSGIGGGMYGAGQNVNAVQAALMMLKALGYFQYQQDFGDSYILATVKQATEVGLFDMIDSKAEQALTRNEVAQMALNALKSEMVNFTGNPGVEYTGSNGESWVGGYKAEYTPRTSTESKYQAIERRTSDVSGGNNLNRGQYYIQLGEELYNGDLRLSDNTLDDFGRPARTWIYKGEEIGTYAKKELLVESYILGVKGSEIYAKLGQDTIRRYDLDAYVDGYLCGHNNDASSAVKKDHLVRSNDRDLANTGRGVLTELYRDDDLGLITIVSINTYLAQATVDYNESTETVALTVYNDLDGNGFSKVADIEDVPNITGLKKDDWCLVQWADRSSSPSSKVVVKVMDTEIMTDKTITGFSSETENSGNWNTPSLDRRKVTKITTDGTVYENNVNAFYEAGTLNKYSDDRLVKKTYNIFLDQYGNFIGAELYSGKDQYVFITGYDRPTSAIGVSTAKANGIFADGTMAAISVDVKDTNANIDTDPNTPGVQAKAGYAEWKADTAQENMWYRYTEDKGVYTLAPVDGWTRTFAVANDTKIDCSNVRLTPDAAVAPATNGTGNAYGEDASVYITVEYGDVDKDQYNIKTGVTDVTGVYTGVQNVKLIRQVGQWAHAVYDAKNNYIVACVVLGEAEGVVDNYAYIRSGAKDESVEVAEDGTRTFYWKVDVIMNGVKETKTIKSKYSNTTKYLVPGTVQELVLDADGYVTKINSVPYISSTEGADPMGPSDKKDKVYSNYDFLNNNNTPATFNSTDLADYNIYDIDVNNAAFNTAIREKNDKGVGAKGQQPWGYYNNLALQGSTLIFDAGQRDKGLTVMNDAKAVICHTVKQKTNVYDEYSSVGAAFNALRDADGDASTNTTNLKQFSGRIVAVLNSTGRAEWVLFIDNTPEQVTDPGYGGGDTSNTSVTNLGGGNFQVRYSGTKTDAEIKALVIAAMESYTGLKVTSYNYPLNNVMTFADGSTFGASANVTPVKQVAVKVDGVEVAKIDSGVAVPANTTVTLPAGNVYLLNATHGTTTIPAGAYTGLRGNTYTSDINFYVAYQVNITGPYATARAKVDYKDDTTGNWTPTDVPMYFAKNTQIRLTGQAPTTGVTTGTYRRFVENITEAPLDDWKLVKTDPEQMLYTVTRDIQVSESTDYVEVKIDGHDYGKIAVWDSNNGIKAGSTRYGYVELETSVFIPTQGSVTIDANGVMTGTAAANGAWARRADLYGDGSENQLTTFYSRGGNQYYYAIRPNHGADGVIDLVRAAKVTGISSAVTGTGNEANVTVNGKNMVENMLVAPGDVITVKAAAVTTSIVPTVNGTAKPALTLDSTTNTYTFEVPADAYSVAFTIS